MAHGQGTCHSKRLYISYSNDVAYLHWPLTIHPMKLYCSFGLAFGLFLYSLGDCLLLPWSNLMSSKRPWGQPTCSNCLLMQLKESLLLLQLDLSYYGLAPWFEAMLNPQTWGKDTPQKVFVKRKTVGNPWLNFRWRPPGLPVTEENFMPSKRMSETPGSVTTHCPCSMHWCCYED